MFTFTLCMITAQSEQHVRDHPTPGLTASTRVYTPAILLLLLLTYAFRPRHAAATRVWQYDNCKYEVCIVARTRLHYEMTRSTARMWNYVAKLSNAPRGWLHCGIRFRTDEVHVKGISCGGPIQTLWYHWIEWKRIGRLNLWR